MNRYLKDLPEVFDSVIDSGLFHVFSNEDRKRYVGGLASVLKPGGRLFLLCLYVQFTPVFRAGVFSTGESRGGLSVC